MKKYFSLMMMVMVLVLAGCSSVSSKGESESSESSVQETEVKVEAEVEVEEEDKPVVVAGTVSTARILYELGVELTAIPQTEKGLPEAIENLPSIGMPMNPDVELVKSHDPDFFITDASLEERLSASLETHGIPTTFVNTSGYQSILDAIDQLGAMFGKEERAAEMLAEKKLQEEEALSKVDADMPLKIAIIFGTPDSFMLATEMSYVGDLAARLGAENITSGMGARGPYVPFSMETLAEQDPDMIFRMSHTNPEQMKRMFDEAFDQNPFYDALTSVKEGRVVDLDPNFFGVVATVDCGEAIIMMAEHLYGE